ncbi:MAG: ATPase, T2SS/T4P/T4SS family [Candidatus Neomarinimicrobiota bacterium]
MDINVIPFNERATPTKNPIDLNISAVEIVELLLHQAVTSRASDIHLESREGALSVRYRIDGLLSRGPDITRQQSAVLSRLKILANMDIAEKRRPQDGKFSFSGSNGELDVRVSTLPGIHGEKIVLRLLNRSDQNLSADH